MKQLAVALLKLPDNRYVFQRRTDDAPINAGLLGFFGGHVESNESYESAVRRELSEETSLDINKLLIRHHSDFVVDREGENVHYHLFEISIPDTSFEVYEGQQSESYSADEALNRADLTSSVKYALLKHGEKE